MKLILINLLLILFPILLIGQEFTVFGGLNKNRYFNREREERSHLLTLSGGQDFYVGMNISEVNFSGAKIDFAFSFERYSGSIYALGGGKMANTTTDIEISKQVINLSVYPINVRLLKKRLKLNFGAEASLLFWDQLEGAMTYSTVSPPETRVTEIDDHSDDIINPFSVRLLAGIQYKIAINDRLYLKPRYEISYGITNELAVINAKVSPCIQRFLFGVGWYLSRDRS